MRGEFPVDPVAIDVGRLVQRSVASLYSHLVTRPTGRAVRLAIETQLGEQSARRGAGRSAVSLIDLSEVTVLDFSCADEVVAKLILRYMEEDRPRDAFFVFRGVGEPHRDPIEAVLERQELAAVAETGRDTFELLGARSADEVRVWERLEGRGTVAADEVREVFPSKEERAVLARLARRRVVFREAAAGVYHALSRLVHGVR